MLAHEDEWKNYTYLHLAVDSIAATNLASRARTRIVVTPAGTALTIGTITSHVASITTDAADDARSKVLSLRTIVLAMADLATVLTSLILVVTEGTIQRSEFSELVTLELVLAFGDGCSLGV